MFYVYAYYRKDWTPYYIGKGKGWRARDGQGKPCKRPKEHERIVILDANLTEEQAFYLEKLYVSLYGRKDIDPNGILYNKSLGGQGPAGVKKPWLVDRNKRGLSSDAVMKIKATRKRNGTHQNGERNPNFGNKWSKEKRSEFSVSRLGQNNPNFGRKVSAEVKAKMSLARKKYWENKRGNQPTF